MSAALRLLDAVYGYQRVDSRYAGFTQSAAGMKDDLLTACPPQASLALLLGTHDIYLTEKISPLLQYLGIEYEILYDRDLLSNPELLGKYRALYLPGAAATGTRCCCRGPAVQGQAPNRH